jgi:uncharacterized protein YecE (DUF72 family)
VVEVDSPYYALPNEKTSGLWVNRTQDGFRFDIKAFRLFTRHPATHEALPKDFRESLPQKLRDRSSFYLSDLPEDLRDELWHRFEQALLPLDSAGKLGVVLFQFPPWFGPGNEQRNYILRCQEKIPQYRIAVEFRNSAWLDDRNLRQTLAFLQDHNLPYVCVDEPQGFRSSIPPLAEATADIALIRFHGRNRETWEKKGITAAERFDYLYTEAEPKEWLPKIKALAQNTKEVHVLFNNCYADKAVINARQTKLMLE